MSAEPSDLSKLFGRHRVRLFASVLAVAVWLLVIPSWAEQTSDGSVAPPEYMAVVAPTVGWLDNRATFPVPVGRNSDGSLRYQDYSSRGSGAGSGITLIGRYGQWTATNVLFAFPQVNHSHLVGGVSYVQGSLPTGTFLRPSLGLGLVGVYNRATWTSFSDRRVDDLGGQMLVGYAQMPWISVQTSAYTLFPRLGLSVDLPIQHWYVRPFGSYRVSWKKVRAMAGGGKVDLWDYDSEAEQPRGTGPLETVTIRPFDRTSREREGSGAVGVDYLIDFHYFVQQRGEVSYDMGHKTWTVRMMVSSFWSMSFGVMAYFEYSEKETVSNTFFLIGPA